MDNEDEINSLKQSLHHKFAIKDMGVLKYFLGNEIATSYKGLFLNQRKYLVDLLEEARMVDNKPCVKPLDNKLMLEVEGDKLRNIGEYQRLVGKLIYLTIIRPDISFVVQNKVINTVFTRSHDQLADIFTKSLPSAQFSHLLSKLGSINLLDPA
ncbi:hypothetical protein ACLB2K_064306 [Fragaria x ananassa]